MQPIIANNKIKSEFINHMDRSVYNKLPIETISELDIIVESQVFDVTYALPLDKQG